MSRCDCIYNYKQSLYYLWQLDVLTLPLICWLFISVKGKRWHKASFYIYSGICALRHPSFPTSTCMSCTACITLYQYVTCMSCSACITLYKYVTCMSCSACITLYQYVTCMSCFACLTLYQYVSCMSCSACISLYQYVTWLFFQSVPVRWILNKNNNNRVLL
jgi:hypothetical protein